MKLRANIVDIEHREVYFGEIGVENGCVVSKTRLGNEIEGRVFLLPGLVDSHVHIESSMLVPQEFAKLAVKGGVVSVVADPHEIANVCGVEGVKYMLENSNVDWFKFYFGLPSCVPATSFESSGAELGVDDLKELVGEDRVVALAEVMNFPGVIYGDKEVIGKIDLLKSAGKRIDGHAPGVGGDDLIKYANAGVETDHECMNVDEAKEKIAAGMMVQIREGSAARNFDNLIPLLKDHSDSIMFCNDDAHPDDLIEGYMNKRIARGIELGYELFDLLKVCVQNPVEFYGLDVGLMRLGDKADFILVDNLKDFNVSTTIVNGNVVYDNGIKVKSESKIGINNFNISSVEKDDLNIKLQDRIRVIDLEDGELYTKSFEYSTVELNDSQISIDDDILKLVVLNRYSENAKPAVGFIKGFNLKSGAIASTVAHDSHNIVAVGTSDVFLYEAISELIKQKGGIVALDDQSKELLPLEIAGLMTGEDHKIVIEKYKALNLKAKKMGSSLNAPFMSLAFMSLLVIPELKLSDKGLFDGIKFEFTDVTF